MARDEGLEERVREALGPLPGLTERRMFGGTCVLLDGHMLCGASDRGLMARLGPGREAGALARPGVAPMVMQGRPMAGWVLADPSRLDDAALRGLLDAALSFTRGLPPKA